MSRIKRVVIALMVVLLALGASACQTRVKTPSDAVAVHVGGGPWESKKPKGCVDAGTNEQTITNDTYALFPTNEREWDATGQSDSDGGEFKSVTKDNVEMKSPVTIRFSFDTSCKTLTDFYLKYAKRYDMAFDDEGKPESVTNVRKVFRKLVKDPADTTLDRIIQDYNWRDVWNNPATKTEIESRFGEALQSKDSLMVQTAHEKYFEGISVLVGKSTPVNKELSTAVAQEQTNVAKARSAQEQAKAELLKARAEIAVKKAEAIKKKADLSAYGSETTYLKELCIQTQGCQPFPSPIIPGAGSGR